METRRNIFLWLLMHLYLAGVPKLQREERTNEKDRRDCASTLHSTGTLRRCWLERRRHSGLNYLSNWKRIFISTFGLHIRRWSLIYLTRAVSVSRAGAQIQGVLVRNSTAFWQHISYFIKPTCSARECVSNAFLLIHERQGMSLITVHHFQHLAQCLAGGRH